MTVLRCSILAAVIAALTLPSVAVTAQSKEPFVGTWVLDRSKSEFDPPTPFQRRTMAIEETAGGLSFKTRTISDRLQATETSYVGRIDGTDVPIEGSVLETVSLKRVNSTTIERTGKMQGKAVETVTMRLSSDGKTLTLTQHGSNGDRKYSSTQVFLRQ